MDLLEVQRLIEAVGGANMDAVRATRQLRLLDLAEGWVADTVVTGLRESTLAQYRLSLGLLERAGVRVVADVTRDNVRAFMRARLAAGRSPETANRNLAAVSSLMTWLHTEGRVPLAQVLELRELYFERAPRGHPPFLSKPQLPVLRAAARVIDERLDLLVAFGVCAGLRYHEAVQLHREDLELGVAEPFVRIQLTEGRANKREHERSTPIPAAFAREILRLGLAPGPIFPARVRQGEELLSRYLHRGTFRTWRERSIALDLASYWDWHLLRHTFASWHVQAGVSIAKVAMWMGNSVEICARHYASLAPGGDVEAERAFAGVAIASAPPLVA